MVSKIRKKSFSQKLIERLVKPENLNWPREMKIWGKLKETYPDEKLWINVDRKVNSLAHFLTNEGQEYLDKIKKSIEFEPLKEKEMIELSKEKLGEDIKIKKPLSIKEFLGRYK